MCVCVCVSVCVSVCVCARAHMSVVVFVVTPNTEEIWNSAEFGKRVSIPNGHGNTNFGSITPQIHRKFAPESLVFLPQIFLGILNYSVDFRGTEVRTLN